MPDERNARPVSGEIMAASLAGAEPAGSGFIHADVVDAQFETIRPGEPAVTTSHTRTPASIGTVAGPTQGLDSLRKSDAMPKPQGPVRGGPVFWVFGFGLAAGAFWVSGGHALVRQAPFVGETAPAQSIVNALHIVDVKSRVEEHGGRPVLFVDGKALNDDRVARTLPQLEIDVTANDGTTMRYNLGTSTEPLAPGAAFGFSSRLEAPKEGVRSVSVTFQE
jgi:hypothetical protein